MFGSDSKKEVPASVLPVAHEYRFEPVRWTNLFTKAKYIPLWLIVIIAIVSGALLTIYHDQIVETLLPVSKLIRDIPGGWLIPIAVLVIISFPPLFGHEIVALLCGVVYGLWVGFAVVAAGTFIGELGTWYAFKYILRSKARKMERTNIDYGAMTRMIQEGGFMIVFLIRLSLVPAHFSTAVFATSGAVPLWAFSLATFLTLPKQITIVYLGVILAREQQNNKINAIVISLTVVITVVVGVYVYVKLRKFKRILMAEQAASDAARQALPMTTGGIITTVEMRASYERTSPPGYYKPKLTSTALSTASSPTTSLSSSTSLESESIYRSPPPPTVESEKDLELALKR